LVIARSRRAPNKRWCRHSAPDQDRGPALCGGHQDDSLIFAFERIPRSSPADEICSFSAAAAVTCALLLFSGIGLERIQLLVPAKIARELALKLVRK